MLKELYETPEVELFDFRSEDCLASSASEGSPEIELPEDTFLPSPY